jgi:hypothetical protein
VLRALEALAVMRRSGTSLTQAARQAGTTRAAMLRYASPALRKDDAGRYTPTAADRLYRELRFLSPKGVIAIGVTSSRTASRISRYMVAVDHFLLTGDTGPLREFRGKAIRSGSVAHPFLTDPKTLERLAGIGEVSFENLYAHAA